MNASVNTLPAGAANTKPLWAAVGVLGVSVAALGASLVYVQSRPVDGHAALAALHSTATPELTAPAARVVPATDSLARQEDLVAPSTKPPVVTMKPPVPRPVTKATAAPGPAPAPAVVAVPHEMPAPAPVVAAAGGYGQTGAPGTGAPSVITSQGVPVAPHAICANCGTVEAVTPIQRNAQTGTGAGAVAGGALGAVLGNQIGKGGGRSVATILGAVGGGLAGNAIEKNMKKETVYQVQLRMEDGSVHTLEQSSAPAVGARITLDGNSLRSADSWPAAPAQPRRSSPQLDNPQASSRT